MSALPPELLHAVSERAGRIALVIGAGCSLEQPTNLRLASHYAEDAHRQLVANGVLMDTDCATPWDLSAVASAVKAKCGEQAPMVRCLPRNDFRLAQPNDGYLLAAALLRERVIADVLTLNFDLALTHALGVLSASEVSVVPGPQAADQLGASMVVYLHRCVEELDLERWILTVEALTEEWQDHWEEVVARRVVACPVVVFVGLGSPAAVLTQSVTRVREALEPGQHQVYVVDPAESTQFEAALNLAADAHHRLGWSAFMQEIANRLLIEFVSELATAGTELCTQHNWPDEVGYIQDLCTRLHSGGLVVLGKIRATWLLDTQQYTPDDARRSLIADLLLGVGLVERAADVSARFREDGVVELVRDGATATSLLPASGSGTLRWSALEPKVLQKIERLAATSRPEHVLVSGVMGQPIAETAPPEDLISGDAGEDIVQGFRRPTMISVDDVRANPNIAANLVA